MTQSKMILGYWPIRGLNQPICLLLADIGKEYEDKRYMQREEWFKQKPDFDLAFPNLPYLIDGDLKISESLAIIRYICRKYCPQLLALNDDEEVMMDQLHSFLIDYNARMVSTAYKPNGPIDAAIETLINETIQPKLDYLSKYLGNKPYLLGDSPKFVDYILYEILDVTQMMYKNVYGLKDEYRVFKDYLHRFSQRPNIRKYLDSDTCIKQQVNSACAVWDGVKT